MDATDQESVALPPGSSRTWIAEKGSDGLPKWTALPEYRGRYHGAQSWWLGNVLVDASALDPARRSKLRLREPEFGHSVTIVNDTQETIRIRVAKRVVRADNLRQSLETIA